MSAWISRHRPTNAPLTNTRMRSEAEADFGMLGHRCPDSQWLRFYVRPSSAIAVLPPLSWPPISWLYCFLFFSLLAWESNAKSASLCVHHNFRITCRRYFIDLFLFYRVLLFLRHVDARWLSNGLSTVCCILSILLECSLYINHDVMNLVLIPQCHYLLVLPAFFSPSRQLLHMSKSCST